MPGSGTASRPFDLARARQVVTINAAALSPCGKQRPAVNKGSRSRQVATPEYARVLRGDQRNLVTTVTSTVVGIVRIMTLSFFSASKVSGSGLRGKCCVCIPGRSGSPPGLQPLPSGQRLTGRRVVRTRPFLSLVCARHASKELSPDAISACARSCAC